MTTEIDFWVVNSVQPWRGPRKMRGWAGQSANYDYAYFMLAGSSTPIRKRVGKTAFAHEHRAVAECVRRCKEIVASSYHRIHHFRTWEAANSYVAANGLQQQAA